MIKFRVQKSILFAQLSRLYPFAGRHPLNPIWEYFKFKLVGNQLAITVVDHIHFATIKVEVDSSDTGLFCLPIYILKETLPELEEEVIQFVIFPEKNSCEINTSSGRYKFSTEQPSSFPVKGTFVNSNILEFNSFTFLENLAQLVPIASTEELRVAMSCVYVEASEAGAALVATDGFRLSSLQTSFPLSKSFLVSRKSASLAKTLFEKERAESLQYEFGEGWLKVSSKSAELYLKLIDEVFPNYRGVIPSPGANKLILNKYDLLGALQRAIVMNKNSSSSIANTFLTLHTNQIMLSSTNLAYENFQEETLEGIYKGQSMRIAFNPSFLIPLLSLISDEEITLHFIDETKPIFITGEFTSNRTLLILPVRIQEGIPVKR